LWESDLRYEIPRGLVGGLYCVMSYSCGHGVVLQKVSQARMRVHRHCPAAVFIGRRLDRR
jgi:hypothetical protein